MSSGFDVLQFGEAITRYQADRQPVCAFRRLAWYAAAVASADDTLMGQTIRVAREAGVERAALYEIVLQSYLFVGFPRMLIAAEHLDSVWPSDAVMPGGDYDPHDSLAKRRVRGEEMCRRVYAGSYQLLRARVQSFAPQIWAWMIEEGYGKVLSRPQLDAATRELCTVAVLMVDLMPRQLHSHMRGALNVGATEENLRTVVEDLKPATADGYRTAMDILARLGRT